MIYNWPNVWDYRNGPKGEVGRYAIETQKVNWVEFSQWMKKNIGDAGFKWHHGSFSVSPNDGNYINLSKLLELKEKFPNTSFAWVHTEEHAIMVNSKYGKHAV